MYCYCYYYYYYYYYQYYYYYVCHYTLTTILTTFKAIINTTLTYCAGTGTTITYTAGATSSHFTIVLYTVRHIPNHYPTLTKATPNCAPVHVTFNS